MIRTKEWISRNAVAMFLMVLILIFTLICMHYAPNRADGSFGGELAPLLLISLLPWKI